MKTLFKDLFEYNQHFNQKLIELYIERGESFPEKSIKLLNHVVNAHCIWNSRLDTSLEKAGIWQLHEPPALLDLDKRNYKNTLNLLDTVDFTNQVDYVTSQGQPFKNNVRDILFHVVNHGTHHRGQIASDLKQAGIDPIISDYIFYKR